MIGATAIRPAEFSKATITAVGLCPNLAAAIDFGTIVLATANSHVWIGRM